MLKLISLFFFLMINLGVFCQSVIFKTALPEKGSEFVEVFVLSENLLISAKSEAYESNSIGYQKKYHKKYNKLIRILDLNDKEVTKIEVTYSDAEEELKSGEKNNTYFIPVSNNTYIIEKTNDVLIIQNKYRAINGKEKIFIENYDYKDKNLFFIKNDLSEKKIIIEEKIEVFEQYIKEYFLRYLNENNVDEKYIIIKVILKKIQENTNQKNAFFEVNLKIRNAPINLDTMICNMNYNLTGEIIVNIDNSWILSSNLTGDMFIRQSQYSSYGILVTSFITEKINLDISRKMK